MLRNVKLLNFSLISGVSLLSSKCFCYEDKKPFIQDIFKDDTIIDFMSKEQLEKRYKYKEHYIGERYPYTRIEEKTPMEYAMETKNTNMKLRLMKNGVLCSERSVISSIHDCDKECKNLVHEIVKNSQDKRLIKEFLNKGLLDERYQWKNQDELELLYKRGDIELKKKLFDIAENKFDIIDKEQFITLAKLHPNEFRKLKVKKIFDLICLEEKDVIEIIELYGKGRVLEDREAFVKSFLYKDFSINIFRKYNVEIDDVIPQYSGDISNNLINYVKDKSLIVLRNRFFNNSEVDYKSILIRYLTKNNINKQNKDGDTLLHLIVRNKPSLLSFVLEYKPDLTIKNKDGKIAYNYL